MSLNRLLLRFTQRMRKSSEETPESSSNFLIQHAELCKKCRDTLKRTDVFLRSEKKSFPILTIKHHNVERFEASIRAGCRLCKMLYGEPCTSDFSGWEPRSRESPFELTIDCDVDSKIGTTISFVMVGGDVNTSAKLYVRTFSATLARTKAGFPAPSQTPSCTTFSSANVHLVKHWLRTCNSNHKSCSELRAIPRALPSRLIDVLGGSPSSTSLSLCVLDSNQSDIQYVTLSHCWGKLKILTLTQSNLASFQVSIPQERLSKTFQDCIGITRQLGFRYLWIDSLCIIQDDPEDWARESVRMSMVYGGSSLTIAAANAEDGSHGCIYGRDPADVRPCAIPVGKRLDYYALEDWTSFGENSAGSPLGQRAWVFQERFLSPRILYMGSKQIYWQCRDGISSEINPDGFLLGDNKHHPAIPGGTWDANEWWQHIIQDYSKGQLSHDSDKLTAISGVAEVLADQLGRNYFAGHFEDGLLPSLLWCIEGEVEGGRTRRPPYRAPSWSWASVNGSVESGPWMYPLDTAMCEVIDAQTVTTSGPFGPVEGGSLRLACPSLLKGKVYCKCDVGELNHHIEFERGDGDGRFHWPVRMDTLPCEAQDSAGNHSTECTVYAIALFPGWVLVLKPNNGEAGSFRRIGIASQGLGKPLTMEDFVVNKAQKDRYEKARYLFDAGDGEWLTWYVVSIV